MLLESFYSKLIFFRLEYFLFLCVRPYLRLPEQFLVDAGLSCEKISQKKRSIVEILIQLLVIMHLENRESMIEIEITKYLLSKNGLGNHWLYKYCWFDDVFNPQKLDEQCNSI